VAERWDALRGKMQELVRRHHIVTDIDPSHVRVFFG